MRVVVSEVPNWCNEYVEASNLCFCVNAARYRCRDVMGRSANGI